MSKQTKGLQRWIRLRLGAADSKIVLRNAESDVGKGVPVDSWTISDEGIDASGIDGLVDEVLGRAQDDADGIGGPQRYVVLSYSSDSEKATSRYTFRLRGEGDDDDDSSAESESPTMKGLLTQLMRHNEAKDRALVGGIGMTIRSLEQTISRQNQMIESFMEAHWANIRAREDSMSQQNERDLALLKTENEEARKNKIFERINLLLPAALNAFVGKKVLPGEADASAIAIASFAESMTEEQFMMIQKTLSSEQQIALIGIIKSATAATKSSKQSNGHS